MRKEHIITTNNNQMEEKGMKSRFIHFKKRFVPALSGALMGVMLMSTTCFAAGTDIRETIAPVSSVAEPTEYQFGAEAFEAAYPKMDSVIKPDEKDPSVPKTGKVR